MASLWHLLLMVLSSLLLVAGYKLPTLRFLFQNGASEADVEAHNLRIQSESPQGAPGRWEWKTGEDGSREFPQRSRRRRTAVTISTQAHDNNTGLGVVGTSADAPTTVHTLERNLSEASRVVVATHVNTTESTPTMSTELYEDITEGVTSTGTSLSQNSSIDGTGRTTVALKRTMEVSTVATGKGPLVDVAQPGTSSQTLVGTSDVSAGTPRPKMVTPGPSLRAKGTVREVSATARVVVTAHMNTTESTPTMSTELYEDDTTEGVASTGTSLSQNSSIDGTGRTTVALKRTMEVSTVTTGKGPLVDVAHPGTSSQTLVGTSDVSTGTPRPKMVTPGPSLRAKGTVREVSATAKAASTTIPAKPPSQNSLPVTPSLVSQCLLAIFLLALVAGIFIILSTVLAILLWRQKRAYKLSRNNHTEMVCISSLLAHDEAEEAGGRHPRVRRMRMLGENGSEAEMDNLTLNSFLPDH